MKIHKNIHLLQLFNLLNDFRPYSAIAVIYFAEVTGSYALALAVFSVVHISSALFEVPTGILSDILGRKKTIITGSLFSVAFILFYALGNSFLVLAIGGLLEGISRSFFSGNNEALLYDTLKENQNEKLFPEWLGKTSSMFQVGLGVSALIGGYLSTWSLSLVMWASVPPQVLSVIVAFLMSEPKVHAYEKSTNIFSHLKEALSKFKENYQLRMLSIANIFDFGIGETTFHFIPAFYATLWPVWAVSLVRSFGHLGSAISYWFAGRFIKRFSAFRILISTHIYGRTVGIIASLFPSVFSPILITSSAIFHGLKSVSTSSIMQERFTDKQRATMGSLNSLAGSIFFGIFSYCFGLFADSYGPTTGILVINIILLPNILLYIYAYKKR